MVEQYPDNVSRLLTQARTLLQEEDYSQLEAAALCFEALALFPALNEAAELVLEAFSDPWLIRDNRKAIGRHVDEWDDRPWQQRRRLAHSFRYTSRWQGDRGRLGDTSLDSEILSDDVRDMLEEGRGQLRQDYLLGQSRGSEIAWSIFLEAFKRTTMPAETMLWVARLYADQAYFAESVDVLEMLLARFPSSEDGLRLWAEVRWWRDYQDRIPWIPPRTTEHGRRFRQMMAPVAPDRAEDLAESGILSDHVPPNLDKLPADFELPSPVRAELIAKVEGVLVGVEANPSENTAVDWSYLDKLENGDIDTSRFPEWAQYLLLEIDDPQQELFLKQYLLSYFANPPLFGHDDDQFEDQG